MNLSTGVLPDQVIAYVNRTYPGFAYNTATCYRDVGYIIDSVAFDLTHGGTQQVTANTLAYLTSSGYITGVYSYDIKPFVACLSYMYGTLLTSIIVIVKQAMIVTMTVVTMTVVMNLLLKNLKLNQKLN
jgi:hypothetical protein